MRKIDKIIIATFALMIGLKKCNAAVSYDVPYISTGEEQTGKPTGTERFEYDGTNYTCNYEYSVSVSTNLTIDGYNMQNKSIIENTIIPKENIPAGTSIGLKIKESKTVKWDAKVLEVSYITTDYKCTYYYDKKTGLYECMTYDGMIVGGVKQATDEYLSCKFETTKECGRWEEIKKPIPVEDEHPAYQECQKRANNKAISNANANLGSSYKVHLQNSNDIKNKTYQYTIEGSGCARFDTNNHNQKEINCTIDYGIKSVCINRNTAQVTYRNTEKCESDEIKVDNHDGHWHYFIPLNAKSTDQFALTLVHASQSEPQNGNFCIAAINNNPTNYHEYIKTSDNKRLTGKNIEYDKTLVANGCILGTDFNIPIEQKFYGEETDKKGNTTLKGFNFYYRPIDINNPFPNGIANDSYWKEWADNKKKNPELTKSFDQITYKIDNVNTKEIREYTKNYKYTDWSNMNINGTSNFVTSYLNRNIKLDTFYKLGCGPANESWEECER